MKLMPMRHATRSDCRLLRLLMGGVSLAALSFTPTAWAEQATESGPPPFFCKAASSLTSSGALPRNVPAVPMRPSSLVNATHIDIIGASSTIGSPVRPDDWNPFMAMTWLVAPSTTPETGNVHFRFEERCARTDGGEDQARPHQVDLAFRFIEAAPLPTVAGTVVVNQSPAGYEPVLVKVWTDGVCELRRFARIKVTVDWFAAPELVPFGEAVLARGGWLKEHRTLWKSYGEPLNGAAPYHADIDVVSCNPITNAGFGFVDGRGSFTLRAKLAGAQELPPVDTEVQLACPPTELVGPCSDAGPDVATDAPTTAIDAAYVPDTMADDFSDAASTDAPVIDAVPSTDTANPTLPPVLFDGDDDSRCSIGRVAPGRGGRSGPWLLGFLVIAVSAMRRRARCQ
jgi:hypothetical protein